ncbi:MAG: CDP-glucose 4,6-dehydratase, partial [Elusimicrobia bacterium]|nr:CDP-glucose 4,6-dehydratase [Elusimicrobiota bacterium]
AASLSSARAGNVFGGGDWAQDRLIPDCARALGSGEAALIRNPRSVRPWQFVLDPLCGYLRLAARQWERPRDYAEAWNFGPPASSARAVGEVADLFVQAWGSGRWQAAAQDGAPHEAGLLQLESGKAKKRLDWRPVYTLEEGIARTARWYREAAKPGFDALGFTRGQIKEYAHAALAAGARR